GAANAVLRSLRLRPGDEIVTDDHEYTGVLNVPRHVAEVGGGRVVVARIPFPVRDEDQAVDAMLDAVTDRTRIAILSHVTSPTALVLPVARSVAGIAQRGGDTFLALAPAGRPYRRGACRARERDVRRRGPRTGDAPARPQGDRGCVVRRQPP